MSNIMIVYLKEYGEPGKVLAVSDDPEYVMKLRELTEDVEGLDLDVVNMELSKNYAELMGGFYPYSVDMGKNGTIHRAISSPFLFVINLSYHEKKSISF